MDDTAVAREAAWVTQAFALAATGGRVRVDVAVPEQQVGVLAAFADGVAERVGS